MEEQTLIKMNNRSKELYNNIITLKIRYKLLNKKYVYNGIILSLILLIILSTFFIKNRNINYKRFINFVNFSHYGLFSLEFKTTK